MVVWGLKFYEWMEIKDLLAYLKALYNPDDSFALKRIINVPGRKIGAKSIEVLDVYRTKYAINYIQIMEHIEDVEDLNNGAKQSMRWFVQLYQWLKEELKIASSLGAFCEMMIQRIGYKNYLKAEFSEVEYEAKCENIDEFINVVSSYEWIETLSALWQFIDEVALLSDLDGVQEPSDAVTLMTIHTAKGLERDYVFVLGIEEWILPHVRSLNSLPEMEEERRLMYVAMTRAREKLYLTTSKERFHFWEYIRNLPSRFLWEIPADLMQEKSFSHVSNSIFWQKMSAYEMFKEQETTPSIRPKQFNDIASFQNGDRVTHPKFWDGIITELSWEVASIAFVGQGVKKMNIKIAPVRKIEK